MGGVNELYTKDGRALQRFRNYLFSRSGQYLGRIRRRMVYDPMGRYVGTIVGDRVVYRRTDSVRVIGPSSAVNWVATSRPDRPPAVVWGDEPAFPD